MFPIGTQQQTYDVFDTNLKKPMPFDYSGTDTVNGIQAYRFTEVVAPTQNGTQVVPGSLVNMTQASVVYPSGALAKHAHVPVRQGICHHFANEGLLKWRKP